MLVGGQFATPGQFPFVASLQTIQGAHFCGGSIIASRWILTAAHCVVHRVFGSYRISVGSNQFAHGTLHGVLNIFPHIRFNINTNQNDIATILTDTNIVFNHWTWPIAVATTPLPLGSNVIIAGWGQSQVSIIISNGKFETFSLILSDYRLHREHQYRQTFSLLPPPRCHPMNVFSDILRVDFCQMCFTQTSALPSKQV